MGWLMGRRDLGGIVIGLVIVLVGAYFVLRDTLGLTIPELNWDQIWPLAVVAVGVSIVVGAWNRSNANHP